MPYILLICNYDGQNKKQKQRIDIIVITAWSSRVPSLLIHNCWIDSKYCEV